MQRFVHVLASFSHLHKLYIAFWASQALVSLLPIIITTATTYYKSTIYNMSTTYYNGQKRFVQFLASFSHHTLYIVDAGGYNTFSLQFYMYFL
jgi:hypothetical protein